MAQKELVRDQIKLRPVTSDDEVFLATVYAGTREEELGRVPWTDEQRVAFLNHQFTAQKTHYQSRFPKAVHDIILHRDQAVGRLYVDRRPTEIHILDIALLTEHRGRGIGSALLADLMKEAADSDLPLTIYVETFNRSRTLFQRLGFRETESDGMNMHLKWSPEA
jgi:ribosomal protein S18 acetylase RimI-like enzyme